MTLHLYKKDFSAGTVRLGANEQQDNSMYVVLVKPQGGTGGGAGSDTGGGSSSGDTGSSGSGGNSVNESSTASPTVGAGSVGGIDMLIMFLFLGLWVRRTSMQRAAISSGSADPIHDRSINN